MVSIIVPIYNASKYLCECLDSIINQTYHDIEVLCIDDGSRDNSAELCKKYQLIDSRIVYIYQENAGVSAARNRGLEQARGEYICFIDSDDLVDPHYIEHLLMLSEDGSMGICSYARNKTELREGFTKIHRLSVKEYIDSVVNEKILHPTIWMMIFKNNIIKDNRLLFTVGCVGNEDTEFYMKYMMFENCISVSDYKGYMYRDNPTSAVHKYDDKSLTIIEADVRISDVLVKNGMIKEDNLIVPSSIQYLVYKTARFGKRDVYDSVHHSYDVKPAMKKVIRHPRFSRKLVAALYIILGKSLFYRLISLSSLFDRSVVYNN